MVFWTLALGAVLLIWIYKLNKDYNVMAFGAKRVRNADGSPLQLPIAKGKTIFANVFDAINLDTTAIFQLSRKYAKELKTSYLMYGLGACFYNAITPEDCEILLNSQDLIAKGIVYDFLKQSLGEGLLISKDKKWHSRRKLLTPAFHFNILIQFEAVFKEESHKFVENLKALKTEGVVSLSELIPKFTLNSICETALGIKLDDCMDGEAYRQSFKMIEECFIKRFTNPIYLFEFFFNLLLKSKYQPHLDKVHEFSSEIIKKRRHLFAQQLQDNNAVKQEDDEEVFMHKKKRYAMLDTLLHAEKDGLIDHAGICEEVDTFMFGGYDTTSMALIFTFMNLSLYPQMQERCYQEIIENIDDDLTKLDISQINNLKYLECFVKETLRLYPSVPSIMRKAVKDTKLPNNLILPEGTQISIHIFDVHRNPDYFPNPDVFNPERFTSENSVGRHPYAYIPFSAGQRNCIGQKFAMLEIKTLIVYVLKSFKLLPMIDPKDFSFGSGIIIRTKNNIEVKLVPRNCRDGN